MYSSECTRLRVYSLLTIFGVTPASLTFHEGAQRPISNGIIKIPQDVKHKGSFQARGFSGGAMQEGWTRFPAHPSGLLGGSCCLSGGRWTAQPLKVPCIPIFHISIRNFTLDVHFPPLSRTSPWLFVHFEVAQVHPGQLLLLRWGLGSQNPSGMGWKGP